MVRNSKKINLAKLIIVSKKQSTFPVSTKIAQTLWCDPNPF